MRFRLMAMCTNHPVTQAPVPDRCRAGGRVGLMARGSSTGPRGSARAEPEGRRAAEVAQTTEVFCQKLPVKVDVPLPSSQLLEA